MAESAMCKTGVEEVLMIKWGRGKNVDAGFPTRHFVEWRTLFITGGEGK